MMPKEERDILDYIVVCISEFADNYGLKLKDAYMYLRNYKGIDFLREFYDVEHTLSFADAVEDLTTVCLQNGGSKL